MDLPPTTAARCLNALLRYELAAIRCYQFAEHVVSCPGDRDELAGIRRNHEAVAAELCEHVSGCHERPARDPALWGVLNTLVETSSALFGRRSMLTVLMWSEQHGVKTYESAAQIDGLPAVGAAAIPGAVGPFLHAHVRILTRMIARYDDDCEAPRGGRPTAERLRAELAGV